MLSLRMRATLRVLMSVRDPARSFTVALRRAKRVVSTETARTS
jgi:hypothetical protein